MSVIQLILHLLLYSITAWLGLYLLASNGRLLRFWLTSGALISYALTLLLEVLNLYAPSPDLAMSLLAWQRPLLILPAFFILLTLGEISRHSWYEQFTRTPRAMQGLIACVVSLGLSLTFIFFPFPETLRQNGQLLMGAILLSFGLLICWIQAHQEEEAFLPPLFRSFDYSFATAFLFGGQIVFLMSTRFGVGFYVLCLLFSVITTSIIIQVFSDTMNGLMDRIAFFNAPQIRQTRAELREASSQAPRVDMALVADTIDGQEFAKLTRRAISQMGNLPKLSSNPLTRLYLYVRGFKPYSQRWVAEEADEPEKAVLTWFRTQVPERTLYNWQKAAAQLVAQDIKERSKRIHHSISQNSSFS